QHGTGIGIVATCQVSVYSTCPTFQLDIFVNDKPVMARIVFLHPDLGIGGAERLIIDSAVALKSVGHDVSIVTCHYNPNHSFDETKDGSIPLVAVGDWLPRSICGYCHALCAYFRMIYAAIYLVFFSGIDYHLVVCDQISVCIPFLKLKRQSKILFYCHYPDQLLTSRKTAIKKMYRAPLDYWEEKTTGMADKILVNSYYTGQVFRETFQSLSNVDFQVLYPSLNFSKFDREVKGSLSDMVKLPKRVNRILLSINRYERKKNIELAIETICYARRYVDERMWTKIHLIIAGGYDERVRENVEYYEELRELVEERGIADHVTFLKSIDDDQKIILYRSCAALIYTPFFEHFGIVPLESMYMSCPVIAANCGGPMETVPDYRGGFLRDPTVEQFGEGLLKLLPDDDLISEMGEYAREHVQMYFSFSCFANTWNHIVVNMFDD
ncbi:ALG2 (predicted), partial [Pycnogonum litorale]